MPRGRAAVAAGEPPSLAIRQMVVVFIPGCPHAMDICREQHPPRIDLDDNHWVNCWLYLDDGGAGGAR